MYCRNLIDIVMSFLLKIDIRKCIHLLIYHLFLLLANLSNCTFTLFRARYTTEDRKCIYVMYATFAPERIQLAAMFTKTLKFCKQILLICSVLWFISRKMKPVS